MSAKILVVEDDPENIAIFQRLLSRKGYETLIADNKEDGIRAATEEQPDLILMDMKMPETKNGATKDTAGLDAIIHLKSAETTSHIPIIALTAQTMVDQRKRIEEAGCDDLQSKPIEFANLLDSIARLLAKGQ